MDREIERKRTWARPWMLATIGSAALLLLIGFAVRQGRGSEVRLEASTVMVSEVTRAPFQEMIAVDGTV